MMGKRKRPKPNASDQLPVSQLPVSLVQSEKQTHRSGPCPRSFPACTGPHTDGTPGCWIRPGQRPWPAAASPWLRPSSPSLPGWSFSSSRLSTEDARHFAANVATFPGHARGLSFLFLRSFRMFTRDTSHSRHLASSAPPPSGPDMPAPHVAGTVHFIGGRRCRISGRQMRKGTESGAHDDEDDEEPRRSQFDYVLDAVRAHVLPPPTLHPPQRLPGEALMCAARASRGRRRG